MPVILTNMCYRPLLPLLPSCIYLPNYLSTILQPIFLPIDGLPTYLPTYSVGPGRLHFARQKSFGILNTRAKKLLFSFSRFFPVSHGQIAVWILELPIKTAKLPSKMNLSCKSPGSTAIADHVLQADYLAQLLNNQISLQPPPDLLTSYSDRLELTVIKYRASNNPCRPLIILNWWGKEYWKGCTVVDTNLKNLKV